MACNQDSPVFDTPPPRCSSHRADTLASLTRHALSCVGASVIAEGLPSLFCGGDMRGSSW